MRDRRRARSADHVLASVVGARRAIVMYPRPFAVSEAL